MSINDFIEYIASAYTLEDVCYILGREPEWLLNKIREELLEHKDDFISGDDYYTGVNE